MLKGVLYSIVKKIAPVESLVTLEVLVYFLVSWAIYIVVYNGLIKVQ